MNKTSFSASWWLTGAPDRKLAGELLYSVEEASRLVLYDHLYEPDPQQFEFGPGDILTIAVPALHGRRHEDGKPITLLGLTGHTFAVPSFSVTNSFDAEVALVGCHVESDAFTRIDIEYDYLRTWAEAPSRVDSSERNVAKIRTDQIEVASFVLEGDIKVGLYTGVVGRWGDDATDLMEHASFSVEVPAPRSALELIDAYVKPLQDLLIATLGVVVRLTEVRLSTTGEADRLIVGTALFPVDQWPAEESQPKSSKQWSQVFDYQAPTFLTASRLFNRQLPLHVGEVIRRWLSTYESNAEVSRQLLAPFYTPFMSPEHRYSSTFQSVEALHSVLGLSPKDLPKPEHAARYTRIVDLLSSSPDIPPEDAEWASKILPNRNDKSLGNKVDEVLGGAGPAGAALLEVAPQFGSTAGRLRGKVAHGGAHATTERRRQRLVYELALRWIVRGHLVSRILDESQKEEFWENLAEREGFKRIVQAFDQIGE